MGKDTSGWGGGFPRHGGRDQLALGHVHVVQHGGWMVGRHVSIWELRMCYEEFLEEGGATVRFEWQVKHGWKEGWL